MEGKRVSPGTLSVWAFAAALLLLSQHLLVPVMCIRFGEDKRYYSPDPGSHRTPPLSPSHGTPSHGTPAHGRGRGGYTPTPSHGGGGHITTPYAPPNCGDPPHDPTPSTPSPPSGGYHGSPPPYGDGTAPTPIVETPPTTNPPSGGYHGTPPPSGDGTAPTPIVETPPTTNPPSGGYHGTPPPSGDGTAPTPIVETPPTTNPPSGGYYGTPPPSGDGTITTPVVGTPPTPIFGSPPTTPIVDPGTPGTPFLPAPITPFPGTSDYWRTHPTLIWGLLGWWGTLGSTFGVTTLPGLGSNTSLLQALSNTRKDAFGALYREGTASWLNAMVNNKFPLTTTQVRENFVAALSTSKAAATQARIFKLANEGHLKPRS